MQRTEINVQTGEKKVIELTPTEVEEIVSRAAALAALPVMQRVTLSDLKAALIAKGVITEADVQAQIEVDTE